MVDKYILYGHGGSFNHGGEALVKTTIEILRKVSPNSKIVLSTHFAEQDKMFNIDADELIERNSEGETDYEKYKNTLEAITPNSVCIHLGGDNYCYPNWQRFSMIHEAAKGVGARSILWSSSIQPSMINDEMINTFRTHDLVAAREGISYDTLINIGLKNVVKVSDIAFGLKPEKTNFNTSNFIAMNLSPLVVKRNPLVKKCYEKLIEYIISSTNMNIVLVPHVVVSVDNDYEIMKDLIKVNASRVTTISDKFSASQYKYIISKARFGIFARTHATIAGYSSLVPTLAIGYSTKASGIAKDLGLSEYVLDINDMKGEEDLIVPFKKLFQNEGTIKAQLKSHMPDYINSRINEDIIKIIS